jgi:hypothetical protein
VTLITEPILGLESIQRSAFTIIFGQFNDYVDQVNNFMAQSDEDLDVLLGRAYVPTVVDPVLPGNFYEGHRPSLIDAPVSNYPNCCVWAVRTTPSPDSDLLDQMSISMTLLFVEMMAKAAPDEGEGICNRRLLRMIEGAQLCVMANPTLRGLVNGRENDPTVNVSEVFTRKETTAYGPHWFWQGARLEFVVSKEAVAPTRTRPPGTITRSLLSAVQPETVAAPRAGIPGVPAFDYAQFIDQE